MSYVFSRSTQSTHPDYGAIAQSGATIALNAEDPNLAGEIQKARDAGAKVAIWLPAHQDQDPVKYGKDMASIVQYYKPDAILPNIEGKQGKSSSGGSEWSTQMMDEYARYVQPGDVRLDVVTEPGETDFNYQPYLSFGGGVVNEAFTGDMSQKNPDEIRQKLIDAGIPPDRINILLAPGQKPGANTGGNFSAYTWDDMSPTQQTQWLQMYQDGGGASNSAGAAAGYSQPGGAARLWSKPKDPNTPTYNQVPDVTPRYDQLNDAHDPAAQAYARAALVKNGVHVPPGADAAAMWRDYSQQRAQRWATERAAPNTPDPWQIGLTTPVGQVGTAVDAARQRATVAMDSLRAAVARPTVPITTHAALPGTPAPATRTPLPAVAAKLGGGFTQVGLVNRQAAQLPAPAPNRMADIAAAITARKKPTGNRVMAI